MLENKCSGKRVRVGQRGMEVGDGETGGELLLKL